MWPILSILLLVVVASVAATASAELDANRAYVLKGTGFAVADSEPKSTQLDLTMIVGNLNKGRGSVEIADGFVTLDGKSAKVKDLTGTILRDGKFVRISGTVDESGDDLSLKILGRLIGDGADGAVYSFTGQLNSRGVEYKTVYASQISAFVVSVKAPAPVVEKKEAAVSILKGAASQGGNTTYAERSDTGQYFEPTSVLVRPGNSVTFTNDDDVSHRLLSGSGDANQRGVSSFVLCTADKQIDLPEGTDFSSTNCTFTLDGRIDTGVLKPGESKEVKFDDVGFYRLIDSEYDWISITIHSFENINDKVGVADR